MKGNAVEFARKAHVGQLDDEGKPYFEAHLVQTAKIVSLVTSDEEVIAAAYLHDVLEDTKTTYEGLKREFGVRVAGLVLECTHDGSKKEGYYFPRLKSRDAVLVKFADRLSNLSRMSAWSRERQEQYLRKSVFWKKEASGNG
jgi:(p)ppGpp synthase/HD superfamily hydrolase